MSKSVDESPRGVVRIKASGTGVKVAASVFVVAILLAIVGASTDSPAIVVGVIAGVSAAGLAFVVIFKEKSALRRDLGRKNSENQSRK
jgi:hypothetical protein